MKDHHQICIIGSGPAGLTAAIYAARAHLNPILFAGSTYGGQLMTTTDVENYPGFPEGIKGPELIQRMIKQAERFGTEIVYENAENVKIDATPFRIESAKKNVTADSVIMAVGNKPRRLNIPSEEKFWGKGISSCATCDGAFFKDKVVAVIGGGDSAMEESTFLTRFAKKVYIIHRRDEFRASKIMQKRALDHDKIEVIWNSEVTEFIGDQTLKKIKLINNETDETSIIDANGAFLAIGHVPQTSFLEGKIDLDKKGYIRIKDQVKTSVPGVFAAGDAHDYRYQQAVTAAGFGCIAALEAQHWLEANFS